MEDRKENNKPVNDIRISSNSRVRNTVNYANILLKENNFRSLHLSAIGGSIGSLVNAVEVIKINNPHLYQINKIGTVSYQTIDQEGKVQNQKIYPKLEVTLTLDKPAECGEGFQEKLSEEERTSLLQVSKNKLQHIREERGSSFRGARRSFRGRGGRGSRGYNRNFRNEDSRRKGSTNNEEDKKDGEVSQNRLSRGRGGFRGRGFRRSFNDRNGENPTIVKDNTSGDEKREHGSPRGGFKRGGFRGGPRGGFRGGFNGFRGFRGGPRGSPRGGRPRGSFRGPRGGPRGRGN
jgi:hypothetical protein